MNSKKKTISRRRFLKDTSTAIIGSTLLFGAPEPSLPKNINSNISKVILIRNKDVIGDNGLPEQNIVEDMLDLAVSELTGKRNPQEGWKTFIIPEDIVGIKTNIWKPICTPKEIEAAIKKKVMEAGVLKKNIAVSDRKVLSHPVFNKATALINVRPMRTHYWSGVGSLIKNYISFVRDPYNYHGNACSGLGKIWTYNMVKGKTRLNVLVMLTPQFHGVGPHSFSPRYVWNYNGLLIGFDPVAVDTIGVLILQAKRKEYFGEERPLNPSPKHIILADTKYKLGNSDPEKIKLIKLGYDKDILI